MQLKDPKARSFTHQELRDAMMETLRFVNQLSKEAGIVRLLRLPEAGRILTC
jgi:hypothetical protein